jgi:SPP1 family predicted phage head-tail adaptor
MRAGLLRHQITVQEQSATNDGMGGETLTWSDLFKTRAAIWPTSSRERIDAMKQELQITHKIRIRYRSGMTSKNRVKFGSRIFNIISFLNPDERNIMIDMLCTEDI